MEVLALLPIPARFILCWKPQSRLPYRLSSNSLISLIASKPLSKPLSMCSPLSMTVCIRPTSFHRPLPKALVPYSTIDKHRKYLLPSSEDGAWCEEGRDAAGGASRWELEEQLPETLDKEMGR